MFSDSSIDLRSKNTEAEPKAKERAALLSQLRPESMVPGTGCTDRSKTNGTAVDRAGAMSEMPELRVQSDSAVESTEQVTGRERYSRSLDKYLDTLTKSLPAKDGENYYDVLERSLPKMNARDLATLTLDVQELNKQKPLSAGQSVDILGDYGKSLLKSRLMTEYDKDRGERTEGKSRAKFSPAYDEAMKTFGSRIRKAAESESMLTRSELAPIRPPRPEPQSTRNDLLNFDEKQESSANKFGSELSFDKVNLPAETKEQRTAETKKHKTDASADREKTAEQALSDFANACHDFVQRTDRLIFLGKWYSPDSAMYKWGEQKFFEASEKSHQDFEKLQQVLTTKEERAKLDSEWQTFLAKQTENLKNMHNSIPLIDESAMILDNIK